MNSVCPVIWQPSILNGLRLLLPGSANLIPELSVMKYLLNLSKHTELSQFVPPTLPSSSECALFECSSSKEKSTLQANSKQKALIVLNDLSHYNPDETGLKGILQKLAEHHIDPVLLPIAACAGLSPNQRCSFYKFICTTFNYSIHLGGPGDIHPALYKEDIVFAEKCVLIRDLYEIEFAQFYYHFSCGKIFGFCRGLQICNVAFGGSLTQEIRPSTSEPNRHRETKHLIRFLKKGATLFDRLFHCAKNILVNSYHHQAVKIFNPQIFTVAAVDSDGTIEALEFRNGRGLLFQFHPEIDEDEPWHRLFFSMAINKSTR